MTLPAELVNTLKRWQWWTVSIGLVALVLCALGAVFNVRAFCRAYLTGYLFWLGLALGSFVVLMIYHLTGGAWGYVTRRILEASLMTLPLLAILFLPIGFGVAELYDWARPDLVAASESLQHKQPYLNVPFFWVRAVVYFAVWIVVAFLLWRWSRAQDRTSDPRYTERMAQLSGPGLVAFGIAITFASVDWIMSLQPGFRSTIFGPLTASGQILSGFAMTLLVLAALISWTPLKNLVALEVLGDLGNLLLAFLVVWGYLQFFQFMLIWIGNLRYDVIWYLPRERGIWQAVALALIFLHLAVPFFLLLSQDVKRNPRALAWVAALILVMRVVYVCYELFPVFPDRTVLEYGLDVLAFVGIGGLWLACFTWVLTSAPILAPRDPNREAALAYGRHDLEREARAGEVAHG